MTRYLKTLLLLVGGTLVAASLCQAQAPARPVVKIGMLNTMFRGITPGMFGAVASTFTGLVESQTGLKGELVLVDSPDEMRQNLINGTLQLGAFHGFEFAWMKLKEPKLEPLMLAAVNPNMLKATVVVAKDSPSANVAQLQGKTISVPAPTREHCRLFFFRRCGRNGCSMQQYFSDLPSPKTAEEALDDVVDGTAAAAVTDIASLQTFQRRKPGRYDKLRILDTSDQFPASVIAHAGLDATTMSKFRDGMATAHKSFGGAQMMGLMKISAFEPVPANYDQVMADIVKAYPPPWTLAQK